MAKQGISTGTNPNDGTGDSLLLGATKINSNFNEVYTTIGDGTTLAVPVTSVTAGTGINLSGSTGSVTITNTGIANTNNLRTDFLEVSGISTLSGGLEVTGNATATQFVGGGAGITGISTLNIVNYSGGGGSGVGNTNNLRTNFLEVSGISTLSGGLTVAGVSTFSIDNSSKSVQFKNTGNTARVAINMADAQTPRIQFISSDNDIAFLSGDSNANAILAAGNTLNLRANTSETVLQGYGDTGIFASGVEKLTVNSNGIDVVGIATIGAGTSTNGVDSPALTLSHNNPTVIGTAGTTGQFKQIGGQPYYYDGTTWRALFLSEAPLTVNQADSDWDNTMIRMNFDQATIGDVTNLKDGRTPSTGLIDLVSSPLKYGTKTARFPVNNSGISFTQDNSGSTYYPFEGAWTLEGWFYFNSSALPNETVITDSPILFANWHPSVGVSNNWKIGYYQAGGGLYNFYWHNKNSSATGSNSAGNTSTGFLLDQAISSTFADNAWHHIAIVREPGNGSIHYYFDGTESTRTSSDQLIDNEISDQTNQSFVIGYYGIPGDAGQFEGNIDDIRISKSARYTSNFTPPDSALPITGSTTTVYEPADSKVGEISLGGSPAWTGTPGVTASQIAAGQYRATFATAYSNATDYVIQTSMNDYTPATTPVGIGVSRFTTHADFFVRRVSDGANIDTGSLAIDLFKK